MRRKAILFVVLATLCVTIAPAQETPGSIVKAYDAMADTILSLRGTEAGFVRAMLDGHRHAAMVRYEQGNWQAAAAEISLFANEGDNAIGGVRKRLLEGGHHFNADGEEQGLFEPGYVVGDQRGQEAAAGGFGGASASRGRHGSPGRVDEVRDRLDRAPRRPLVR